MSETIGELGGRFVRVGASIKFIGHGRKRHVDTMDCFSS
jgi:hypothetical protein